VCGCGCEAALIVAIARQEAEATGVAAEPSARPCPRPDVFEFAGRALVDAIDRIVVSIVDCIWRRGDGR